PETGNDTVFVANGTGGLESNRGGIAFGPDGHLYVTSKYTNNVLRFNGTTGAFMGVFAAGVDQPHDLVFGPDSNLYVANRGTDNVMRFDGTTGAFIDVFVAANSGGMNNPDHLLFGADGHLYVSSATGAGEIYRYDGTTGTFLDIFTAGLNAPAGLFFAPVPGCGENCNNGIDDDGDGLADCDDPHCPCSTLLNLSMCREPDIMSGFISTSYDAATDQLTVSGFAMTFDSVGAGAVVNISGGGFNIATTIDNTGVATAGTLTLSGMAGTYNGTLLTGNLTDFGYLTGGGDLFEFVFDVTGGLMADEFGGVGNQVGVILSALSNFNGNWNLSFSSPASSVADVAPVNCPIGGQVRSDTDNDGDLLDADAGLPGVTVVLYDDPECDGVPNSTLASAITDADGRYYFPNIAEGCYVVQELDLPSYVSTNDKDLVNDNFIALNMPALNAYPSLDNDFLDFISLVEICNNGLDDDGDGLTDCADPDCGPPVLTDVTIGQPDNCPLLNNGQITIAATGTDLQYSIDGGTTYQASGSFAGLSSASYHIRVRNSSSGCFVNYPGNPVVLTNPDCNEICDNGVDDDGDGLIDCADPDCGPSAYAGSDANLCIGSTTTLSATGTGGQSPYSYVWDNGLGAGQTQTVSPLATTTYTVTVTDADMCTATDQITITVTPCAEVCGDGIDNDGDGLLDCDDPECLAVGQPAPQMDEFYTCPGVALTEQVLFNDENLQSPAFSIFQNASNGSVTIDNQGVFTYTPFNTNCGNDAFIYQVCNQTTGCCDTASVFITIGDTDPPLLQNVPADITISCDESLPAAPVDIYALDACPGIYVSFQEDDDLEAASGCQSYTITRTWQATDLCGNIGTGQQIITVQDLVAPEMFRVYTLANGKKIAAGISRRTTNQWKYIEFPINFASVPLIFTQVVSENEPTAIIARQRNVTEEGFELRLQEEENADGSHSVEKVAWIAVEEGNLSDGSFQAASVPGLTSVVKTIPFAGSFSGLPATITCVQTYNEADPFTLRHNNLSSVSIDLWIEEETSADSETGHTGENLALLAVEAGQLEDEAGAFVAETGSVSLTDSWKTIPFVRQYNKPVVVFGSATSGEGPVGIRVRNVTSDAFEVRLQEWDYQDGTHPAEVVSYIVVEGSLPAQAAYYCSPDSANIQPGVNLFATDNCDAQIAFEYSDSSRFTPTGLHVFRQWAAVDDCGNRVSVARTDTCTLAAIKLRVNLFGSMLNNDGSNWMRDDLRQKGYLPLTEPYSDDPVFQHVGNGGGETTTPEILNMPGGDAVVDWVFVELRDGTDQGRVLGTCSALLQRDGDIITPMGDEVLFFPGMGESDYYISIRHRNHLGAIGATPQYMSTYSTPLIDFRADPNNMQGSMEATCTTINGSRALWAGDFNGDGKVIFQGPANDVFLLFSRIVASPENADNLANYILSGYYKEDINMDGNTIYQGPDNDRSPIIYYTILAHPGNSSLLANFIVQDWLP
ncbi:MAG TPA: hypothetical protein ENJ20_07470, partial [Bacteroidetes bacterium]|nr:hypothetical protein [Bacteroidota bacterium]